MVHTMDHFITSAQQKELLSVVNFCVLLIQLETSLL